jgi:hypothetical protein
MHDFDRHSAIEIDVACAVNSCHATDAELGIDAIVVEGLAD